ncbi:SLC5 family protein [Neolewinella agarilytica]|uniref:Solute:Na+ symporter, SSS family n=1 Tax=Neolewinella agarilytica TaxID=478744 RepID=A0A1H9CBY3_9BACT|nr:sodium/solute symporter [Neolewinella agarilytica]SEP98730.1 solute:Na+ symporter, SSS family [Neolewinella agarilytica]
MPDLLIVLTYFAVIMFVALSGRNREEETSAESYFLSNRNLRWPSVAMSTIATNIQGYQFLGMMGSAYLYGLAQANLEINAVQGILLAAFLFVPMYLSEKIITITQFIERKVGPKVALAYSLANLALFATITLGGALFWGAYAAELVFGEYFAFISENRLVRLSVLIIALGVFSAIYTYLGGLAAVVKTDIIQFVILLTGGIVVTLVAVHHLGGWGQLYEKTPQLMHLHLPADHPKLPWTLLFGLFFLNINYWCANQAVVQRSLAARSLREAQIGLMVGGVTKYLMAVIIIVPGIALFGILGEQGLGDPDAAFPYLVDTYIPTGLKGIILCALFASLMSTVDSTFNSLATLWSVDVYKRYLKPEATETQMVTAGRQTILVTLLTGIAMGLTLMYLKFNNPEAAFTHTLNELRYYVNCGIVVVILSAALLIAPAPRITLWAFLASAPLNLAIQYFFPDMNYFVRAGVVIVSLFLVFQLVAGRGKLRPWRELFVADSRDTAWVGAGLALSLVALHFVFH